jgi:mitochondrial chaperone BCS1
MTVVEIDSHEPVHEHLIRYIGDTKLIKNWRMLLAQADETAVKVTEFHKFKLSPGFGRQWLFRHGLSIERKRDEKHNENRLILRCFGASTKPIETFIEAAEKHYIESHIEEVAIHVAEKGSFVRKYTAKWVWRNALFRRGRSMDTVFLEEGVKENLMNDIEKYLLPATEKKYHQRGVPYHRGYLFHGMPRTGKTTTAVALAAYYGMGIRVVTLNDESLDDGLLGKIFSSVPRHCILLLEDVDAIGKRRVVTTASEDNGSDADDPERKGVEIKGVSLAGLLNSIDGVYGPEGYILIMTTNHLDKLDPALIGPGRIDFKIEFKAATKYQAENLFKSMFFDHPRDELERLAEEFSSRIKGIEMTPAEIQNYLLAQDHPNKACENCGTWLALSDRTEARNDEKGGTIEGRKIERQDAVIGEQGGSHSD